jgi:hypothetical protein
MPKRNYPGRLTREQWQALPRAKRHDLARRGQCDVLGSFRLCTNKRCRRADVQRRSDRLPSKTLAPTEEKAQDVAQTLR